jgi:hypothetical protein
MPGEGKLLFSPSHSLIASANIFPSFPFGWLFLPVDLIGRPFSQRTRDHFLPLLTSTAWWSETQLALRRIFQIDSDFQEGMFARQIAVMKGQAWNVVETLKTADHGPLELTRRAKVCVWDDLVDVPVAIPMRVTSAEMRRATATSDVLDYFGGGGAGHTIEEEEMDIGVGAASSSVPVGVGVGAAQMGDLLGLSSPSVGAGPAELPHPGRFELTPTPSPGPRPDGGSERPNPPRHSLSQPALHAHQQHRSLNMYSPERERAGVAGGPGGSATAAAAAAARREHQRRFSFATAAGRRNSNSIAQQLYRHGEEGDDDDGLEGDLGYAAAEGMEGNQRKVIVERLEPVKTRNPVFTWC